MQELAAAIADQLEARRSLLDANQAASLLNVPPTWLMTQARAGRVPHCKVGRYTRLNRDELLALVDGRP